MTSLESLQRELDELGSRVARTLRSRAALRAALAGWERGTLWMLLVPLVLFLRPRLDPRTTNDVVHQRWGFWLALVFAGPLVLAAWEWWRARRKPLDARLGLRVLDGELATRDRLQTAREFLGADERSPFMVAAIEDARSVLAPAQRHELEPDDGLHPRRRAWLAPVAACVLLVLVWIASTRRSDDSSAQATAPRATPIDAQRAEPERAHVPPASAPQLEPPRLAENPPREPGQATQPEERTAQREPEREAKESGGKTGEGRSAQATPTSSSSNSRGLTSMQSQPSNSGDPGKPQTKKPKPLKKDEVPAGSKKKPEQQSGSTAGTGVGSGSSKNPGTSDWQSKDQVSSEEEDPLKDEDEVDDETEESEARGGLQPSLRDRRPAVNRDLTISFGNQPSPDANGRGGPSERKKSRGVASLVLGVPIPDHVKGQPNPGRTKITQERVEPRPDDAAPIEASARTPRSDAVGPHSSPELAPWMRELIRSYFLDARRKSESKS